ncbi:MAG: hypothetical protein ACFB9M_07345 [Myxococcota bacterium]
MMKGLRITHAEQHSVGAAYHLQPGCIILGVNGEEIATVDGLDEARGRAGDAAHTYCMLSVFDGQTARRVNVPTRGDLGIEVEQVEVEVGPASEPSSATAFDPTVPTKAMPRPERRLRIPNSWVGLWLLGWIHVVGGIVFLGSSGFVVRGGSRLEVLVIAWASVVVGALFLTARSLGIGIEKTHRLLTDAEEPRLFE